ncbi:hypothetical protein LTR08_006362 [Meristemomyces frigidus]|nr:hypothetical protein LTR08_006362 [Meristemomyces frigidus]
MAGEFLRSHGIDIDAEMSRIQHATASSSASQWAQTSAPNARSPQITRITNVSLPRTPSGTLWDVDLNGDSVSSTSPHDPNRHSPAAPSEDSVDGHGALLAPSLCHPHIHLDKAYLLSHPKYSDLQIERGDFAEAMQLTGKAKAQFTRADLLERGQRLIDESVEAGVTHMRAFVEVDAGVGLICLEAGVELKKAAEEAGRCYVQLCAFAQLPLFSSSEGDGEGEVIRGLMEQAAAMAEIDCVGSTPYVESNRQNMERNVEWMVSLSARQKKHLDFHLDYNLDPNTEPMVWHVISTLKKQNWAHQAKRERTIVLGHCTRLTVFSHEDWARLKTEIADLPISFVGLPTSDLFMMGRNHPDRPRGTLDVPKLINEYGINACIGINNISNAFTPYGSCDPLSLACNGVGVYQAGTKSDAELLYECVSTRARAAIGLGRRGGNIDAAGERYEEGKGDDDMTLGVRQGDSALLLFGAEKEAWRTRKNVAEAVYLYDRCRDRQVFLDGKKINGTYR